MLGLVLCGWQKEKNRAHTLRLQNLLAHCTIDVHNGYCCSWCLQASFVARTTSKPTTRASHPHTRSFSTTDRMFISRKNEIFECYLRLCHCRRPSQRFAPLFASAQRFDKYVLARTYTNSAHSHTRTHTADVQQLRSLLPELNM